jgi:O-acetyl-ADP-ribose deacetylase (regulator of RNase III)
MSIKEKIQILQGDLAAQDADAIVNAANNDLQLGGGVAGAIRRKGGPAIQEECDRIGPIPLGEAAVTSAGCCAGGGNLKARFVIHAASMRLGEPTSEPNLRASTRASLLRAKELGIRSIAFPAVGTGIAGFPMRRCAEVMLDEALAHLAGETSLQEVRFVLYDAAAYETFRRCFEALEA